MVVSDLFLSFLGFVVTRVRPRAEFHGDHVLQPVRGGAGDGNVAMVNVMDGRCLMLSWWLFLVVSGWFIDGQMMVI